MAAAPLQGSTKALSYGNSPPGCKIITLQSTKPIVRLQPTRASLLLVCGADLATEPLSWLEGREMLGAL